MKLNQPLRPVDIIFILGSRDERVASWAAKLYKRHIADTILVSGGQAHSNNLLRSSWAEKSEAEHFKIILQK